MRKKSIVVIALVVVLLCLASILFQPATPSIDPVLNTQWLKVLAELRHECDPNNPEADYEWSQSARPTERRRAEIIAKCTQIGPTLLTSVKASIAEEQSEELRGLLAVIAVRLGDTESTELVIKAMTGLDHPALRLLAVKALKDRKDQALIPAFRDALHDGYFVVNGGDSSERQQFYPVREIAKSALIELGQTGGTTEELISAEAKRPRR